MGAATRQRSIISILRLQLEKACLAQTDFLITKTVSPAGPWVDVAEEEDEGGDVLDVDGPVDGEGVAAAGASDDASGA